MGWAFSWLGSWDEIWDEGHVAGWRRLVEAEESAATPFMHPAVVRAWVGAMGGERRFAAHFLHATHASGQRVLWPLVRPRAGWRQGYVRRLIPAGTAVNPFGAKGMLFDYHDPVVAPGPGPAPGFWPALAAELCRRQGAWFDLCALPRLRAGCLGEAGEGVGRVAPYGVAPLLRLRRHGDFAGYLASRSPKMRETVRRRRRRAAAAGACELRVFGPEETAAVLAWLPRLEEERRRRWRSRGLPPGWLAALVREGLPAGVVHASALRLDGRDMAWNLGFYLNGVLYGYVKGFDPAFQALSPGSVHLGLLIEWLFARGGHTLDFMLGAEAYKADWTDGEEVAVVSLAFDSRALASPVRRAAARGLDRLLKAAPPPPAGADAVPRAPR
jgi:CelD/BcsL family acetyltransferase involved in cellulose biosynthesis